MGLFNSKKKKLKREQAVRDKITTYLETAFLNHFKKYNIEKTCNTKVTLSEDNVLLIQSKLSGYPLGALPGSSLYEVRFKRMPDLMINIAKENFFELCSKDIEVKNYLSNHNISIKSDVALEDISNIYDAIVLPGGMPGTKNLKKSSLVCQLIQNAVKQRKIVAAICAAPSILGEMQLLKNKCAVCYPGFESTLIESKVKNQLVVQDDIFITGKGPGATIPFALKIVENLTSKQVANSIYASMQCE